MNEPIGFMQGRLSAKVGGRIQAFPWDDWREEFAVGERHGFHMLEWTLDQDRLYENPLLTTSGQSEIRQLCERHRFTIPSLTGDCFMQAPFWKATGAERQALQRDFEAIVAASASVGISMIVVPLVDNGRLDDPEQEQLLVDYLAGSAGLLRSHGVRIVFESEYAPAELRRFIERLEPALFGINYDSGNSAGMGFDPVAELSSYGHRIINVHIKDRVRGGTTVPLGTGDANFEAVFAGLAQTRYRGNFILQTARAADDDHAGVLCRYRDMTASWLKRHAA